MTMTEGSVKSEQRPGGSPERKHSGRELTVMGVVGGLAIGLVGYSIGWVRGMDREQTRHCPPYTETLQLAPGLPQALDDAGTPDKDDIRLTFDEGRLKVDGPAVLDGNETRPLNGDGSTGVVTIESVSDRLPSQFSFARDGNVMKVTFIANPNC